MLGEIIGCVDKMSELLPATGTCEAVSILIHSCCNEIRVVRVGEAVDPSCEGYLLRNILMALYRTSKAGELLASSAGKRDLPFTVQGRLLLEGYLFPMSSYHEGTSVAAVCRHFHSASDRSRWVRRFSSCLAMRTMRAAASQRRQIQAIRSTAAS